MRKHLPLCAVLFAALAALGAGKVDKLTGQYREDDAATLTGTLAGKEPALGNPGVSGCVLSSTTEGVRSWTAQPVVHTQGTDQGLDTGGANATTAAQVKGAVTAAHTQNTDTGTTANQFLLKSGTGGSAPDQIGVATLGYGATAGVWRSQNGVFALQRWAGQGVWVTPQTYLLIGRTPDDGLNLWSDDGGGEANVTGISGYLNLGMTAKYGGFSNWDFRSFSIERNSQAMCFNPSAYWTPGTSAKRVLLWNSASVVAPATSPADAIQLWPGDYSGSGTNGLCGLKLRTEEGTVYQFGVGLRITNASSQDVFIVEPNDGGWRLRVGVDSAGGNYMMQSKNNVVSFGGAYSGSCFGNGIGFGGYMHFNAAYEYVDTYPYMWCGGRGDNRLILFGGYRQDDEDPGHTWLVGDCAGPNATGANTPGGDVRIAGGKHNGNGSVHGSIICYNADRTTKMLELNESKIGFFAAAPAAQQTWTTTALELTDSTGGTAADTIPAPGGTDYTTAELKNVFASLTDEIRKLRADNEALRTILRNYGLLTNP